MKILVTGGTGVLGGSFAALANENGYEVVLASRNKPISSQSEWTYLNLETGEGLSDALSGVEVVFHAATSPAKNTEKVDILGTSLLLEECKKRGVKHFVYPSIVGIDDIPMKYYRAKRSAEDMIMNSGISYTIMRVTQFHNLLDKLISILVKFPICVLPSNLKFQTVDVEEVSEKFIQIVRKGPSGRVDDFGGPEILTLKEMYLTWKGQNQKNRILIPLPYFPGKTFKSFQEGKNTNPLSATAVNTWESWMKTKK
ncbi:SDR family oxidoreductase [Lysinibacillus sphaericus]